MSDGPRIAHAFAAAKERLSTDVQAFFSKDNRAVSSRFQNGLASSVDLVPIFQTHATTVFDAVAEGRLTQVDNDKSVLKYLRGLRAVAEKIVIEVGPKGFWRRIVLVAVVHSQFGTRDTPDGTFGPENFLHAPGDALRATLSFRLQYWEKKAWARLASASVSGSSNTQQSGANEAEFLRAKTEFLSNVKKTLYAAAKTLVPEGKKKSIPELARYLNISATVLYRLWRGDLRKRVDWLAEIAEKLGCQTGDLYREEFRFSKNPSSLRPLESRIPAPQKPR